VATMQANEHKLFDRAAMIEAASHSLRQQMRVRDRPRSKGSLHGMRDLGSPGEAPQQETSRRRTHSAENKYRIVQRESAEQILSASSPSALDSYPAEDEPGSTVSNGSGPSLDDAPPLGELKRPMSRKNAVSLAAGLGACSTPGKMTDAFEQQKTRQPIPIESWGPRPPSRHRLPPNAALLDVSLLGAPAAHKDRESKLSASRSRSEPGLQRPSSKAGSDSVTEKTTSWAAARYPAPLGGSHHSSHGLSEPRNRERQLSRGGWASPRSANVQPGGNGFSKSMSDAQLRRDVLASRQAALQSGSWAAQVDSVGMLEISGSNVSQSRPRPLSGTKAVSVEDVEADQDLVVRTSSFRRDQPPAQVVVNRSSVQKKDRGDGRQRGTRDGLLRGRQSPHSYSSLDVGFLSLFAL